jgi:hypothetical protein
MNHDIDDSFLIVDFIDLISYTLSDKFIEKWRFRFSEKLIRHFQTRLLKALNDRKPIKIDTLYLFLTKKCSYSKETILHLFESIEIELYRPLVSGKLTKHI